MVSSEFQSSMTTFHHKLLTTKVGLRAMDGTHPSSMTIFVKLIHKKCQFKSYHCSDDIKHHMALNIIFSALTLSKEFGGPGKFSSMFVFLA